MNYLGGDATESSAIPSGVTITVTGASTSSDLWDVQEGGCSGGKPCVPGFVFTADNEDAAVCVVAVSYVGSDVPEGGDVVEEPDSTLSLDGRVECPGMSKAECDELAVGIETDDQDIPLDPPEPGE
ncbi:hypothetical protein [Geodermatophilus aquaeductus]|uniref:hypothetical protein n=1 Tax=Geodermatophilus aquaeductus TaxID=1564161 RepID=UPI00115A8D9F|nr:hypothetical protein [Geodermatophilus aquaeductus]